MEKTSRDIARERTIDQSCHEIMARGIKEGVETAWERLESQQPQCGYGRPTATTLCFPI